MNKVHLLARHEKLMGSPFTIETYVPDARPDREVEFFISLAFGEIRRIEDLLTDFRDSPFNDINKMAGIRPVRVCREIFDLVQLSLQFSRESEGAFDISYASVGHLWRAGMKTGLPPSEDQIVEAKRHVNFRKIQMDEDRMEIFLPHQAMRIGFGGIGKGYAVDRAFQVLRTCGLTNFFVNGAGDIRVQSEEKAPRPWRIAVRNPLSDNPLASMACLQIKNGAIATSGDYERFFECRGKKYHHVLDGRSGEITQEVSSATVLCQNTLDADVYATIAMVLGPQKGLEFLNQKKEVSGFLVTPEGKTGMTNSLKLPL